jgi:hypothetical protein
VDLLEVLHRTRGSVADRCVAETPATSWRPAAILTLLAAADEDSKVQRETSMQRSQAKAIKEAQKQELPASQRELPSTPELELKILENEFARVSEALKRKREQLAPQSQKERAAFLDAFTCGDDLDNERAVRAAGLLLDWGFGVNSGFGNDDDKGNMARGLAGALFLAADSIAQTQRRFTALEEKTAHVD